MQAALQGIAPVFIKKWSDPKQQDTFKKIGKEIGLDSVKAETWFKVSGLLWEAGQKQAAAQALKNFADEVQKMKSAASAKDMPLTKNLFRQMGQALPRAMQRDPKVQEILKAFG